MSVLDQMTRNAAERKADASAVLTPVGMEAAPPGAFVSTPAEERRSWLAAITEAREHTQRALAVLQAAERNLNRGLGHTMEADYFNVDAVQLATEVFGDDLQEFGDAVVKDTLDNFAVDYANKSAAAQAATYQTGDLGAALTRSTNEPVPQAAEQPADPYMSEWVCPDHGSDNITIRKGRTREFRACLSCGQYEGKVT